MLFLCAIVQAQTDNPYISPQFDVRIGVVGYSITEQVLPSVSFGYSSSFSPFTSIGVFINGYTALQSQKVGSFPGNIRYVRPQGYRGGLLLRLHTRPEKSHIYLEAQGSWGNMHNTGLLNYDGKDRTIVTLFNLVGGFNVSLGQQQFVGLYLGAGKGKRFVGNKPIERYEVGFMYISRL